MELRERIAVGLAMSMGIFATVCAVIKCTHLPSLSNPDFTYELSPIIIWSAAEASATIMAACVPSLRVLARTARFKVKEKLKCRSKSRGMLYDSRGYTIKPFATSSMANASWESTRPELRSQLSFEKWAMGVNEDDKGTRLSPENMTCVDGVTQIDWKPPQNEEGDMEQAMALDSLDQGHDRPSYL